MSDYGEVRPPDEFRKRFCPKCGLLVPSTHNTVRHRGANSRSSGEWCLGKTRVIVYQLKRAHR